MPQFHATTPSVDSGDFLPLLKRLDDCIAYIANNPQYADAATYSVKFRQLQSRALAAVRTKVQHVLKAAATAASTLQTKTSGKEGTPDAVAVAGSTGGQEPTTNGAAADAASGAAAALLYVRFRAAAEPALKGLLAGIEQRAQHSSEYQRLLKDCQALYCETRLALMQVSLVSEMCCNLPSLMTIIVLLQLSPSLSQRGIWAPLTHFAHFCPLVHIETCMCAGTRFHKRALLRFATSAVHDA